jgi:hypothetical protein
MTTVTEKQHDDGEIRTKPMQRHEKVSAESDHCARPALRYQRWTKTINRRRPLASKARAWRLQVLKLTVPTGLAQG